MDRRVEAALDALDPAGRKLQWLDHRGRWFDAMAAALAAADAATATEASQTWAAERSALRQGVAFFASAIKSGEPWTATCERILRSLLDGPPPPEPGS